MLYANRGMRLIAMPGARSRRIVTMKLTRLGRLSLAGIAVTVGGVAVLAAVVAHSGTAASAAELAPAMTLIGLGMGATFSTIYDTAIGDIDPAEAGSASGSLSSVQQLANAIGPAVITTVYFGALAASNTSRGTT